MKAVIMESVQVWPEFAAAEHACVKHALPWQLGPRLFPIFLSGHKEDIFNVIQIPNIFQDLLF